MGDRQGREQEIMSDLILFLLRAWYIEVSEGSDGRHFGIEIGGFGCEFGELEAHGEDVINPVVESLRFLWIVFPGQMGTPPQLCYSGERDGE